MYLIVISTDVPKILGQFPTKVEAEQHLKPLVRDWLRSQDLSFFGANDRLIKPDEDADGVALREASFGWQLIRLQKPEEGWFFSAPRDSIQLAEIRILEIEESHLAQRLSTCQQQLEHMMAELERERSSLETLRAACSRSDKMVAALQNELSCQATLIEKADVDKAQLELRINQLQQELAEQVIQNAKLDADFRSAVLREYQTMAELDDYNVEMQRLTKVIETVRQQLVRELDAKAEAIVTAENLREKLMYTEKKLDNAGQQLMNIVADGFLADENAKAELQKAQEEKAFLTAKLNLAEEHLKSLELENELMDACHKEALLKVKTDLDLAEHRIVQMDQHLETLNQKFTEQDKELRNAFVELSKLRVEHQFTLVDLAEKEELVQELEALKPIIAAQTVKLSEMRDELCWEQISNLQTMATIQRTLESGLSVPSNPHSKEAIFALIDRASDVSRVAEQTGGVLNSVSQSLAELVPIEHGSLFDRVELVVEQMKQKDNQIKALRYDLKGHADCVERLHLELDDQADLANNLLAQKDQVIQHLEDCLTEKDDLFAEKDQAIQHLEDCLIEKDNLISELRKKLEEPVIDLDMCEALHQEFGVCEYKAKIEQLTADLQRALSERQTFERCFREECDWNQSVSEDYISKHSEHQEEVSQLQIQCYNAGLDCTTLSVKLDDCEAELEQTKAKLNEACRLLLLQSEDGSDLRSMLDHAKAHVENTYESWSNQAWRNEPISYDEFTRKLSEISSMLTQIQDQTFAPLKTDLLDDLQQCFREELAKYNNVEELREAYQQELRDLENYFQGQLMQEEESYRKREQQLIDEIKSSKAQLTTAELYTRKMEESFDQLENAFLQKEQQLSQCLSERSQLSTAQQDMVDQLLEKKRRVQELESTVRALERELANMAQLQAEILEEALSKSKKHNLW